MNNPFKNFSLDTFINKIPDFASKVPDENEFINMSETELTAYMNGNLDIDLGPVGQIGNSINSKIDGIKQKFYDKAKESLGIDISGVSIPSGFEDYERLAYEYGPKIGVPQGVFDKYEELKAKVDSAKELVKEKSIEYGKEKAKELGIDIPEIPSEEELVNMIADINPEAISSADEKVAAIEQFIQSKLNF